MSFGGFNSGRQQGLPFSNAGGAPPQGSKTMQSRTGSFSSNPAPPPPLPSQQQQSQQQQQQQHGSPYSSQTSAPTSQDGGGEAFYSGVRPNIHTTRYRYNNNNNNASYRPSPNSPVTLSSPYPSGGVTGGSSTLPAYSRRNGGGIGGGGGGNASGLGEGGYGSGYDSPSGISTSVPYSFNTNNGLHRPHPQHPQPPLQQHQQQHMSSYQQQQQQTTTTTRQLTQRHYPRTYNRRNSNASETSLNIDTCADTTLYSPGPASLSSARSSRRGSFSDASGGGTNGGGGFFARQRTYRPSTASAVSNADDDLDMNLGNKNSPRRHRQKRMTKKLTANRNLLGAVGGMRGGSGGKSSTGSRMSGILNDWDLLLPGGDPYDDMGEDEGGDDGMNENERWKKKQLTRRGWESRRGQGIILGLIVTVAVFVRIWKLAVPGAVV
ncbi:hypothetical protein BGW39_006448 [Mortierella sp. 14UC]|nr:hypothetical protein BGW39_006448 [Mortierella sp. 14UC]